MYAGLSFQAGSFAATASARLKRKVGATKAQSPSNFVYFLAFEYQSRICSPVQYSTPLNCEK